MKCYTSTQGGLVAGIAVVADERLGKVIYLGEDGRGRRWEKVGLDRQRPPSVTTDSDGEHVLEAEPRAFSPKGQPDLVFYSLRAPNRSELDSSSVLVRIRTAGPYTRHTDGFWKTLHGSPNTLLKGHGANGDAGRLGTWDDGLVVLAPGDAVKVVPIGGAKSEPYVLEYSSSMRLRQLPERDWLQDQALSQAEEVAQ